MKEKKRTKLLNKALRHAKKVEKRSAQLAIQPELDEAYRLRVAIERRIGLEAEIRDPDIDLPLGPHARG